MSISRKIIITLSALVSFEVSADVESTETNLEGTSVSEIEFKLQNDASINYSLFSSASYFKYAHKNMTTWAFTTVLHPAYPSVIKFSYTDEKYNTYSIATFLCESEKETCDSLKKESQAYVLEFNSVI